LPDSDEMLATISAPKLPLTLSHRTSDRQNEQRKSIEEEVRCQGATLQQVLFSGFRTFPKFKDVIATGEIQVVFPTNPTITNLTSEGMFVVRT
jgi:hypothetical protein